MSLPAPAVAGISRAEFKQRRRRLLKSLGSEAVAVFPSAPAAHRNRDVEYPYRQDSDFHYLTGFDEPEAIAVFIPGRADGEFVLFCRPSNPEAEIWTGAYAGVDGARRRYAADQAHPIGEVNEHLPQLLENRRCVYYPLGNNPPFDLQMFDWVNRVKQKIRAGVRAPDEFICSDRLVHQLRQKKSPAELDLMRHAAAVSAAAHQRAMRACRPGLFEHQIEAELLHEFHRHGLRSPAYPSIVAGGRNACVLHYVTNADVLRDGDLLLIDAGGEYQSYAADITRTFPVNGAFDDIQKAVYEIVLAAQLAGIAEVKPGAPWNSPHVAAVRVLTEGLRQLGVLKGKLDKLIDEEAYKPFYMHRTGHWLGMDVHDVGEYKLGDEWYTLEPGMVLTVEPGLYFAPANKDAPKRFRGIGIRIEDDVLVTEQGCEVLTVEVPKTVQAIEAHMSGSDAA